MLAVRSVKAEGRGKRKSKAKDKGTANIHERHYPGGRWKSPNFVFRCFIWNGASGRLTGARPLKNVNAYLQNSSPCTYRQLCAM